MTGPGALALVMVVGVGVSSLLCIPLDTQETIALHLPEVLSSGSLLDTRTVARSYLCLRVVGELIFLLLEILH